MKNCRLFKDRGITMSSALECAGAPLPESPISRTFAWLARLVAPPRQAIALNPALTPDDRLRDIGLLDGRGPSLRRPERG
jgi:hypothetical protein